MRDNSTKASTKSVGPTFAFKTVYRPNHSTDAIESDFWNRTWRKKDYLTQLRMANDSLVWRILTDKVKGRVIAPTFLEAGCGMGQFVALANSFGWKAQGVDYDEKTLQNARLIWELPNSFSLGDVRALTFEGESFDCVISLGVLEHLQDHHDRYKALLEHYRVLKREGIFILTLPRMSGLLYLIRPVHFVEELIYYKRNHWLFHQYHLPDAIIASELWQAGFTITHRYRIGVHAGLRRFGWLRPIMSRIIRYNSEVEISRSHRLVEEENINKLSLPIEEIRKVVHSVKPPQKDNAIKKIAKWFAADFEYYVCTK
jgi:SAM-dependent methyltransferase